MFRRRWRPAVGRSRLWGVALVMAATTAVVARAGSAPGAPGAPVTWVSHAKLATAGPGRTVHAVGSASPPARPSHFAARQPPIGAGRATPAAPAPSPPQPR